MTELNDHEKIGSIVITTARIIFSDCDAKDDFCIQHVSPTTAVFGGTNRMLWDVKNGFAIDKGYCTDKFRRLWETSKYNSKNCWNILRNDS